MAGLGAASRLRLDVHGTGWYPVASTSGRCGCARVGVAGDLLGCASRARAPAVQPLAARPRRHARAPPTVTAAAAPGGARDAAAPPARPSRSAPEAAATAAEASAPPAATAEAGEAAFGRAASLSRAAMSAQPLAARAAAAAAARGPSVGASARRSASGGGRAAGGGAPASFLVVLAGGALAAAAALRAKARLVRECSTCRGYGVERCALCAGRGAIEWEGKMNHREPCPRCLGRRLVRCACCGGGAMLGRRVFRHSNPVDAAEEALRAQLASLAEAGWRAPARRRREALLAQSDELKEQIMMD